MSDDDTLAGVVIGSTKRLSEVVSILTRRAAELRGLRDELAGKRDLLRAPLDTMRGLRHRLWEGGLGSESAIVQRAIDAVATAANLLDEDAIAADRLADTIEIAISVLARERIRLDVAAVGSAEQTYPGRLPGERRR